MQVKSKFELRLNKLQKYKLYFLFYEEQIIQTKMQYIVTTLLTLTCNYMFIH